MTFETIYKYTSNHYLATISVKEMLEMKNIQNWKYNRPADMVRVSALAEYTMYNRPQLDTMIYCNYNSITNKYEIYDGIHRISTLKYIADHHEKDKHDYINGSIYGGVIDWLMERKMVFNIRVCAAEGEIMEAFMSLNKSVPIPELYMENPGEAKRICIEKVVETYQHLYKSHFSASVKVQRPNTNRELFMNFVSRVYDFILPDNENQLIEQLDEINNDVRSQVLVLETQPQKMKKYKITESMIAKCKKTNCYMFMENLDSLLMNFA